MRKVWRVFLAVLAFLGLMLSLTPPVQADVAGVAFELAPGHDTVTGVIEIRATVPTVGVDSFTLTAQMGRPGDYPTQQTLVRVRVKDQGNSIKYEWETDKVTDGYWTIRLMTYAPLDTKGTEAAVRTVLVDNRWGVPSTEPGTAFGTITVQPSATGTVAVNVKVDPGAVDWTLTKQPAASLGTNQWTKLYGSGLRADTFHWYTRDVNNGVYTLRLEVRDSNYHRQYTTATVTVDNRAVLPQTEPGTAAAKLTVPAIISNQLPIDLAFNGLVSIWRLSYIGLSENSSNGSIATGQGGAPQTPVWNTTKAKDGTYQVLLEVEDEHRHILQTTAQTTVANTVTSTLKQTTTPGEEHQYIIAVAGGLTAFRLNANLVGYYRLAVQDLQGKTLGSARVNPNSQALQLDLPGGKYVLSVKALFIQPDSEYTVDMKGATAYTIPLSRMTTNLPLSVRLTASVPALLAPKSSRPSAADWAVDGSTPVAITKPDSTVDIDTRPLPEGLHTLAFRSSNPVGFTAIANFPFVVDNQASFTDVPDTDPAHWAAELLHDQHIALGYPGGTFKPAGNVSRAELAKMLAIVAGLDVAKPYSGAFTDVKATDWFAPYVEAVYQAGIVKGSSGPKGPVFRPGDPVSRGELMVMVLRALNVPEMLTSVTGKILFNPDWKDVPEWAKPSVFIGLKVDLLSERDGQRIEAGQPALRGEVAMALGRLALNGSVAAGAANH